MVRFRSEQIPHIADIIGLVECMMGNVMTCDDVIRDI